MTVCEVEPKEAQPVGGEDNGGRRSWLRSRWSMPCAFTGLGVLLFFAYLAQASELPIFADGSSQALQAWDMLHGNVLLHGWVLSDVSFYTTELPQYMLIEAVRGLGPEVVNLAAAMTYTLLVLLAGLLAKGNAGGREGLARFLLASPPRAQRLHGDPHPGNFRLTSDGRLAVVDFGSSLPMPTGWPPRLEELLRAGRDRDTAALFAVATEAGLVGTGRVTPEALLDLVDPLLEPLRHDKFTFDRAWMRALTGRFSDPRSPSARTQRQLRVPVRHLLVQRVAVGTTGVLCLLGAPVPVATEVAAWMPVLRRPSAGPGTSS